ncbi:MAG: hypothetical protein ABI026_02970 [Gemmatimonadaceae bacterium]
MDPDVINFAGVMVVIIGSLAATGFLGIAFMRFFHRAKMPRALPPEKFDEQFAQLQQSVDSIAVEVERIAESQRFSTRLLSEANRSENYSEDR